jgi:hypothetical protein
VTPVERSCTKTSAVAFVSPGMRFEAMLEKQTIVPSADTELRE